MPTQTEAGKAFEYALLQKAYDRLSENQQVDVIVDSSYNVANACFNRFDPTARDNYYLAADAAINHIIELEPRLLHSASTVDSLTLQIVPDIDGRRGDVRDILFIRSTQEWQIGISAKNNHMAVKHSRLSNLINFGQDWLNLNCSDDYFAVITPIFQELSALRDRDILWRNVPNKFTRFYVPILEAFRRELLRLEQENPNVVTPNLLQYLLGNQDFYKVIKRRRRTEIYGFHLYDSLNKPFGSTRTRTRVPRLRLPSRIIEFVFKPNSTTTLFLACDEGWQLSFRLHSARGLVEPSLKFDINLLGQPPSLYSHHIAW